ncbi:hypothetical protein ACET6R_08815 [Aeromonas veronii]
MASLTICPHFLTDYKLSSPADVEKDIIKPLIQCLKLADEHNIPLVLSKEILILHRQNYPWNLSADPIWAKYLATWNGFITSYLTKVKIMQVDNFTPNHTYSCSHLSSNTITAFSKFIEVFGSGKMHGGSHEEGIFISASCNYNTQLDKYHSFSKIDDIVLIKFPWLRIYDRRLPYMGDFPYIPNENWRNFPIPIRSSIPPCGYLDKYGNSWQWDRLHNNHWDVQHPPQKGGYTNVSPDGKVI